MRWINNKKTDELRTNQFKSHHYLCILKKIYLIHHLLILLLSQWNFEIKRMHNSLHRKYNWIFILYRQEFGRCLLLLFFFFFQLTLMTCIQCILRYFKSEHAIHVTFCKIKADDVCKEVRAVDGSKRPNRFKVNALSKSRSCAGVKKERNIQAI